MREEVDAILKEANVTVSEYQAYADKVGRNEALKHRVREGILYQVAQHGGPKFLEPKAQLGKLTEIGRFRASGAKSGSQAHPKGKSDKQAPAPTTKARTGTSPGPRTPAPPTRPSSTTREPTGKSSEETAPQSDEKAPLGGSF